MAKVAKRPKTLKYVLAEDLYDENPFTLRLKPIPALKFASLEDRISAYHNRDGIIYMNNQQFYYNICKHGITNWENLLDEDGNAIKPIFLDGLLSDESLDFIIADIEEIGSVINAITRNPSSIATYEALTKRVEEELKAIDKGNTEDTTKELTYAQQEKE